MKTNCHNCGHLAQCSTYWEIKSDGAKDAVLFCGRCVWMTGYKFVAYVLGR